MFDDLTPGERGTLAVLALSAQRHMARAYDYRGRLAWSGDNYVDMVTDLAWIAARADSAYTLSTLTRDER